MTEATAASSGERMTAPELFETLTGDSPTGFVEQPQTTMPSDRDGGQGNDRT